MYNFTVNYPNSYGLLPTANPEQFVATREINGAIQLVGVKVEQSATEYLNDGFTEVVTLTITTTIPDTTTP